MSAVISPCGRHRLVLTREVQDHGPIYGYFGINPSTADASVPDPTVRKLKEFTRLFGGRRLMVGNVFTYRAAQVKELRTLTVAECNLPESLGHLLNILQESDVWVPMWGDVGKVNPRHRQVIYGLQALLITLSKAWGKPLMTFGLTKHGSPGHPLFLPYSTILQPWSPTI